MPITGFEKTMGQQWLDACNGTAPLIQVTLFPPCEKMNDEDYFLAIANGVLQKVDALDASLKISFLGAVHSAPAFHQLGFSCPRKEDGRRVFDALVGHFKAHPSEGNDIRLYSQELKR